MNDINALIKEYKDSNIQQQLDYDKLYLYSIITHSTAIEGSTITEIENKVLFDDGIGINKPVKEQFMNLDLKEAYTKAFQKAIKHEDYSINMLCELSGLLLKNTGSLYNTISGTFDSSKGELRLINVTAGSNGKSYMSWQKVPLKLEEFCRWLNTERKKMNSSDYEIIYKLSFAAHYNLVTIHPWADGNGRMARLVMNMIQQEFNAIPSIVKKEKRLEYIKSLDESQQLEDISKFLNFMMEHHCENIKEELVNNIKSLDESDNLKFDSVL